MSKKYFPPINNEFKQVVGYKRIKTMKLHPRRKNMQKKA
jgi:hypothetical protein